MRFYTLVLLLPILACGRSGAHETATSDPAANTAPPAKATSASTTPSASAAPSTVDASSSPTTTADPANTSNKKTWDYDLFSGVLEKRGATLVLTLDRPVDIVNMKWATPKMRRPELHGVREVDVVDGVDLESRIKVSVDEAMIGRPVWIIGSFKPNATDPTKVTLAASQIIDPSKPALRFGDKATLTGKLVQKDFESPQGGTEKQYVLVLDKPIDVTPSPSAPNGSAASKVRDVTLVLTEDGKPWLNKHVTAKGSLFAPNTGHHHTHALMDQLELTKANP